MSSGKKTQIYESIACFLKKEVDSGNYSSEVNESLEVAMQCIESAFGFSTARLSNVPNLLSLFSLDAQSSKSSVDRQEVNGDNANKAETLKNKGNQCMKENQFQEAVTCYSQAIELSPKNAVFYCNRAAAYSRLDQHHKAIDDCQKALRIEPKYSKAYGRMGIAYSGLGDYAKAVESYRKGLEIDPDNEAFQQNLALAEERLRESTTSQPSASGLGGLDFSAILNNPMMQNIACQLMRDPNTQNVMADLFRNTFGSEAQATPGTQQTTQPPPPQPTSQQPEPQATANNTSATAGPAMDQFLRLGHQLAQQLRSANPELVDQLRQTFHVPPSDPPGRPT